MTAPTNTARNLLALATGLMCLVMTALLLIGGAR